jgi:hypothetical protein
MPGDPLVESPMELSLPDVPDDWRLFFFSDDVLLLVDESLPDVPG